jgi:hypothetical protein
MDVHVPASITRALRRRKIDVLTAQEDGASETPDAELLDRASLLKRVILRATVIFLRRQCGVSGRENHLQQSFMPTSGRFPLGNV